MKNRISAAHLALVVMNSETKAWAYFGLINKGSWEKKKVRLLTPPGGALLVRPAGEQLLVSQVGAQFLEEREPGGIDARFLVEEDQVELALTLIEKGTKEQFELDVERELAEELGTAEIPSLQSGPLVSAAALAHIHASLLGVYRQPLPADGVGSSANTGAEPTRRLFFCWGLRVNNDVWQTLQATPLVELLSETEVSTTNGGRTKGKSAQGSSIGDNLFTLPEDWKQIFLGK